MSIWGVGNPRAERLGDLETVGVIQHGRPAVGKTFGQLAHKHVANKARDPMASLRLGQQPAQHLHGGNVVLAKLLGQFHEQISSSLGGRRLTAFKKQSFLGFD